jgi:virginiamycin B lyase
VTVIPWAPKEKPLPDPGYGLTAGANDTVWICLKNGLIARYSAKSGSVKTFSATTSFTEEGCSMVEGPDGNVWFTDYSNDRIGKITPAGQVTFFSLGSDGSPLSMTVGSDGALWFTEYFANKIGRLTTDGQLTTFNVGGSSVPLYIVAGPDGNLWYNDGSGNIYSMTTSGKSTLIRNVYRMGGLWSAFGHIWFWTAYGYDLEEMSTDGSIVKSYSVNGNCLPGWITEGPKNSIWFVDSFGACVTRMTLSGKFFTVPTYAQTSNPNITGQIILGPKGYLWYEIGTKGLGWIDPSTM